MEAWKSESDFKARVLADADIRAHLSPEQIEDVFRMERYLVHVDTVFARVFAA
jgi:adenylosuccinate lyase